MNAPSTRTSLLSRLRDRSDHRAWKEFEEGYRPLIVQYCRRRGLHAADSEDVAQQVMTAMAVALPGFLYDPKRGLFRSFLLRCARNALVDWARCPSRRDVSVDHGVVSALAAATEDPSAEEADLWEKEWVAHHYRRALETVRMTFAPRSVELFERLINGASATDLAREYDMTDDAVVKVRQRVRARMEELIAQQVREEDEIDG